MSELLIQTISEGAEPILHPARPGDLLGGDAFDAGMWPYHRDAYLGTEVRWSQNPAMIVLAPPAAEDSGHVPFLLDATGLPGRVRRIVVTIDYNPFPLALIFHPGRARPFLGFAVKYESGGALRVSGETEDGTWHVGGAFVSALGGGCSAPATAHARPGWQLGLGEIRARLWHRNGRLRLRIRHPQDTGLTAGIPAHHLTSLVLRDVAGEEITRVECFEPLEENPSLTFALPPAVAAHPVTIEARDTMGGRFSGRVEPSA